MKSSLWLVACGVDFTRTLKIYDDLFYSQSIIYLLSLSGAVTSNRNVTAIFAFVAFYKPILPAAVNWLIDEYFLQY